MYRRHDLRRLSMSFTHLASKVCHRVSWGTVRQPHGLGRVLAPLGRHSIIRKVLPARVSKHYPAAVGSRRSA